MKITIKGNYSRLEPFEDPGLKTLLTNKRQVQERGPRGGTGESVIEEEPLYFEISPGSVITYTGLIPRLERYCKYKGVKYHIEDLRIPPSLPDFSRLKGKLRFAQKEAIAAVASSFSGQVKLPTANGKTQIIAILTELYRGHSKVVVVSENSSVLKTIYDRIKEFNPGVGYILNKDSSMVKKVDYIVCSTKSLHKLEAKWADILLYDEVHSAAAPVVSRHLSRFSNTRMFGFTATPKGRSDNSELVIEALFGPEIINVSYSQSEKAGVICPIKVYMVPVEGGGGDAMRKKSDIARDRQGIWRNRIRNQKIADVVHNIPKEEQVLIVTNTAEHVFRIRKFLPDFIPVHGGLSDKRFQQFVKWGLIDPKDGKARNPNVNKIADGFRKGDIRGVIATNVWKEGVDFPNLAFLVRADGKRGAIPSIQIGGRLSRKEGGKNFGVLLDFYDDLGRTFIGRTKDRMRFYKKEGWAVEEGWPNIPRLVTELRKT